MHDAPHQVVALCVRTPLELDQLRQAGRFEDVQFGGAGAQIHEGDGRVYYFLGAGQRVVVDILTD